MRRPPVGVFTAMRSGLRLEIDAGNCVVGIGVNDKGVGAVAGDGHTPA